MGSLKYRITSEFGVWQPVREGAHTGIDLAMPVGTSLRSVIDGTILKVYTDAGKTGNGITIQGVDGKEYTYAHMEKVVGKVGDSVQYGQYIGNSGNTGNSTGPHLHFEVQENGEYIDPTPIVGKLDSMSGNDSWEMGGPSNTRIESMGGIEKACGKGGDASWYNVEGKFEDYMDYQSCVMKYEAKEQIYAMLGALADVIVELSYAAALIGGTLLILLHAMGVTRAKKYFFVLQLTNVFIKAILGTGGR